MSKPAPGPGPGIVIIYYRGRLVWLEGEMADPEIIGERTAEAVRAICEPTGQAQECASPDDPPSTLH